MQQQDGSILWYAVSALPQISSKLLLAGVPALEKREQRGTAYWERWFHFVEFPNVVAQKESCSRVGRCFHTAPLRIRLAGLGLNHLGWLEIHSISTVSQQFAGRTGRLNLALHAEPWESDLMNVSRTALGAVEISS